MPFTHVCPRRTEAPDPTRAAVLAGDVWETGHGLTGQDNVGLSCSYCGSLNPDRFMQLVREGWWVDPTDKPYKVYLAVPLDDEQIAMARQRWMDGPFVSRVREAAAADTADNVDAAVEHEWQQMPAASGHGQVVAKVYLQHLSEQQRDEFVALANAKTMRIGDPGYFYVLPFFCRRVEPAETAE